MTASLLPSGMLPRFGVVDWFVEDDVGQADASLLRDLVATSPLAAGSLLFAIDTPETCLAYRYLFATCTRILSSCASSEIGSASSRGKFRKPSERATSRGCATQVPPTVSDDQLRSAFRELLAYIDVSLASTHDGRRCSAARGDPDERPGGPVSDACPPSRGSPTSREPTCARSIPTTCSWSARVAAASTAAFAVRPRSGCSGSRRTFPGPSLPWRRSRDSSCPVAARTWSAAGPRAA